VDDTPARTWQTCPVCTAPLPGEQDAVDAHIDSCLAHAAMVAEDAIVRTELGTPEDDSEDGWQEVEVDGVVRLRPGGRVLQASGIHIRTGDQDVEEEIDIDGDDDEAFGVAQFTERDVVPLNNVGQATEADMDVDVDVDGDDEDEGWPQDATVASRTVLQPQRESFPTPDGRSSSEEDIDARALEQANAAIDIARRSGNRAALLKALEGKIQMLVSLCFSTK
jgi:hypothetical protein